MRRQIPATPGVGGPQDFALNIGLSVGFLHARATYSLPGIRLGLLGRGLTLGFNWLGELR